MISSPAALNGIRGTGNSAYALNAYEKQKQADTVGVTNNAGDTVQLSLLSRLGKSGGLVLPTIENVRELSAELSDELGTLFLNAGIPTQPPVDIDFDYRTNTVTVDGDRSDTDRIEALINGNDALKRRIHTLTAISSHAYNIQESLAFQREYRASGDPRAVAAKYSYLFNANRAATVGLRFGERVDVLVDGRPCEDVKVSAKEGIAE